MFFKGGAVVATAYSVNNSIRDLYTDALIQGVRGAYRIMAFFLFSNVRGRYLVVRFRYLNVYDTKTSAICGVDFPN